MSIKEYQNVKTIMSAEIAAVQELLFKAKTTLTQDGGLIVYARLPREVAERLDNLIIKLEVMKPNPEY